MFVPVFVSQSFCGHLGKEAMDGVSLASTVSRKEKDDLGIFFKLSFIANWVRIFKKIQKR